MGLFDFLGKKKKEKGQNLLKSEKQLISLIFGGVDTEDISEGYGAFGLCETNPVPTQGILGSHEYLSRLRTKDGHAMESRRIGSTSAENVTSGVIDVYKISCNGSDLGTIYLCPYYKKNSGKAPDGFCLV